jgi:hypothetical protein
LKTNRDKEKEVKKYLVKRLPLLELPSKCDFRDLASLKLSIKDANIFLFEIKFEIGVGSYLKWKCPKEYTLPAYMTGTTRCETLGHTMQGNIDDVLVHTVLYRATDSSGFNKSFPSNHYFRYGLDQEPREELGRQEVAIFKNNTYYQPIPETSTEFFNTPPWYPRCVTYGDWYDWYSKAIADDLQKILFNFFTHFNKEYTWPKPMET